MGPTWPYRAKAEFLVELMNVIDPKLIGFNNLKRHRKPVFSGLLSHRTRAVAVLFGLQQFYLFIFKHKMDVQFDDKTLESIMKTLLPSALQWVQHMLLRYQKYDVRIRYCPGKSFTEGR